MYLFARLKMAQRKAPLVVAVCEPWSKKTRRTEKCSRKCHGQRIVVVVHSLENGNEPKARRAVARNRARRRGTAEGGGFRTFLGVRFQRHSTIRCGLFFACSPELSTDLTCTDDTGTDNWPTRMDAEPGG
jgi:hypothetical protein